MFSAANGNCILIIECSHSKASPQNAICFPAIEAPAKRRIAPFSVFLLAVHFLNITAEILKIPTADNIQSNCEVEGFGYFYPEVGI